MILVSLCIRKNRSTLSSRETISGDLLQTEAQWLHQTHKLTNSADTVLRWTECHWGMVCIQYPHHQKTHAQDTHSRSFIVPESLWSVAEQQQTQCLYEGNTFLHIWITLQKDLKTKYHSSFCLNWVNWAKIKTWASSEQASW